MQHLIDSLPAGKRAGGSTPPGEVGHDVHFYRSDAQLTRVVIDFLVEGARARQPLIVIATVPHMRVFEGALRARGLDAERLLSGREAEWLDARDTLASFMVGTRPDRELFMATVGNVFERVLRKHPNAIVRAYGEMVNLLWNDGNTDGAIQLEELWNELAAAYSHSLLCGYSVDSFLHEAGVDSCRRICEHHTHASFGAGAKAT